MVKLKNWSKGTGVNVWFNRNRMIYLRIGDSGSQRKPAPPYYVEVKIRGKYDGEWQEIGSGKSTKEIAINAAISYMKKNQ